jgi:hypothetical protein
VNKILLVAVLLLLALTGVNTFLLLQMGGRMKEIGDKIEPVAKSLDQLQGPLKNGPGPQGAAREGDQPAGGKPGLPTQPPGLPPRP